MLWNLSQILRAHTSCSRELAAGLWQCGMAGHNVCARGTAIIGTVRCHADCHRGIAGVSETPQAPSILEHQASPPNQMLQRFLMQQRLYMILLTTNRRGGVSPNSKQELKRRRMHLSSDYCLTRSSKEQAVLVSEEASLSLDLVT